MTAELLVFGWGNRSRGDDALGPLFIEKLQAWAAAGVAEQVDFIEDYQLQPEHALDLRGRRQVLFVDASLTCQPPFSLRDLSPQRDRSFTSHALSPASLLQVYREVFGEEPPRSSLLAIRGEGFDLGAPPCESALHNLHLALESGRQWLVQPQAAAAMASPSADHLPVSA